MTTLLEFIHRVVEPAYADGTFDVMCPPQDLDYAPKRILLSSYATMSWCWSSWDERRVAHSEIIDYLSAVWLSHICRCPHDPSMAHEWTDIVVLSMSENPATACAAFARLIQYALTKHAAENMPYEFMDVELGVLRKACWGTVAFLRTTHQTGYPASDDLLKMMVYLFVALGNTAVESTIKDIILEGLSYMKPNLLLATFDNLQDDLLTALKLKLDNDFLYVGSLMSRTQRTAITPLSLHVSAARHLLQFLTLTWCTGFTGLTPCDSVVLFLQGLVDLIFSEYGSVDLLDHFLTTRTAFGSLKLDSSSPGGTLLVLDDIDIWKDNKVLYIALSDIARDSNAHNIREWF
ncbi:hypothetical protein EUX98_g7593 [Antrodiella citrinella]|uniref:Uncharacterized protein n=1 Tax=Antrodiella citrinella TaxID=2447956 RepID=A0A4V3XHU3_9APHY|nr:hypothetical protein EUX98_g7593 [Antrodiella citrinella]